MNPTTDWFDVSQITENCTQITETENVRMFLVTGTEKTLLVDAGRGVGDLAGLVSGLTDNPVELLLTHWHWDHIGNAAAFSPVYIHPSERADDGRVTIDAVTDEWVDSPSNFIDDWQASGNELPDSFDASTYAIDPVPASQVITIEDGESIDVGDRELVAHHTPGHTPGHLVFLDAEDSILYGGDLLHLNRGLFLHFETGDVEACLETFERVTELYESNAFETLVTGHNEPISGDELDLLYNLRDGLEAILGNELEYELIDSGFGQARQYIIQDVPVLTQPNI